VYVLSSPIPQPLASYPRVRGPRVVSLIRALLLMNLVKAATADRGERTTSSRER
jgi:hypothetical protein